MRKNVASQTVSFQMVSTTDGSDVTAGTPAVYYTVDGGVQGTGSGAKTHEGNGQWSYVPAQAETNGDHVAFTMVLAGAVSQTVNVWPVAFDPTDSVRAGLTALPDAAADAAGGLPISDAGGLNLDGIIADTNELQGDWTNGGRLDLIVDAILADTGTGGVVLSAAQMNKVADHVIRRGFENACDSADGDAKSFRSLLGAIAKLVNKVSISGTTLTITEDDDTTSLGTQTLTTDASAEPITAADTV